MRVFDLHPAYAGGACLSAERLGPARYGVEKFGEQNLSDKNALVS